MVLNNANERDADNKISRELLTVDETAIMLGVSRSFIYQHAHQLPRVKIGHIVKFSPTSAPFLSFVNKSGVFQLKTPLLLEICFVGTINFNKY